jgi:hypothetical protein
MFDGRRRSGNPGIFRGCGVAQDNQQHLLKEAPHISAWYVEI